MWICVYRFFGGFLRDFSTLYYQKLEDVRKVLFDDLSQLESKIVDLRNKGLVRILEIGVGAGEWRGFIKRNTWQMCCQKKKLRWLRNGFVTTVCNVSCRYKLELLSSTVPTCCCRPTTAFCSVLFRKQVQGMCRIF